MIDDSNEQKTQPWHLDAPTNKFRFNTHHHGAEKDSTMYHKFKRTAPCQHNVVVSRKTTPCTITDIWKAITNTCAPQTTNNINHSFAAMDVCFPVSHPEPDYLVANKDDKVIDKPNPMN